MSIKFVTPKNAAPSPIPYSPATVSNGFVFVSGQVPMTAKGTLVQGSIQDQAQQCFDNLETVLKAANSSLDKIVKLVIFSTDMSIYGAVNEVYAKVFKGHRPARTFVAVKTLPVNATIEIEAIAIEAKPKL